ncbi:endonuclease/exonuclease/phosphatase family protein [Pseudoxanthomonas indica]|uniref:Metal-dependent hydrolase, endonuclease/exonuclease/phosphatase family n=1 Tax=Pseudoxanthomonas indica TaxID=428993 RepID=A0A1T5JXP6_9GAMM|nr:endonuclease/exonuclease/phosphatase family protein [Pseudoxanthomonas indica]GGD45124.1 endonuclease [Pseudoxanthomonas indica]SKC56039.1 Metal-dependent hydrolase, endonuclease/exonuclease/phosphatase family [Pseudoxanthomonas indica]
MRRLLVCLLLLIVTLPITASETKTVEPLRVVSFNVRLPAESDGADRWDARKELFVDTVRRLQPDVMGTQELWKIQGDYIVEHLPGYRWFGRGRRGDDSDEHMGVFYRTDRLRVIESGDFWLSDTPEVAGSISWNNLFPRMVTWALFERLADKRRFYLFNTHLPYRDQDDVARERGAALIAARIAALPADIPVVLTGDFNTTPDSAAHRALTAHLQDAWDSGARRSGPAETFHAFKGKPDHRIDWILQRGLEVQSVATDTQARDGRYPSDHFPVVTELRWPISRAAP